ncbi:hypothetical protein SAPIO_CDS7655 [Scedosporium apiospermum]|uniref:Uncharacterized protein n=1 Tax=Pseudallescheria apiosperma TaxID=563466 RepID=A0A084G2D6_PSEDA|nr:uncharacterized protein SAPIO_CDS7655 [Scedosporium apiospermum]KEZ41498.1 hypothetical protein SAPIO_CDS7655 [Scedosporium apiospermum]
MIKKRYGGVPQAKHQIVRELADKIPWHETEAAKVLSNEPGTIRLNVQDGFVRVFSPAAAPKYPGKTTIQAPSQNASSASASPTVSEEKPRQTEQTRAEPSHSVDSEGDKPRPEPKKRPRTKNSWLSQLWPWVEVAREAAFFFMKARKAGGDNRGNAGGNGEKSKDWSDVWGLFQKWWSGPPKTAWAVTSEPSWNTD